jgi:threonine dehydrogenase-like Zn-dependent dehydrogenase
MQAIRATRPGGHVGYVGVAHGVELPGEELFFSHVHLHGGPAPVRRFLPELIDLICTRPRAISAMRGRGDHDAPSECRGGASSGDPAGRSLPRS